MNPRGACEAPNIQAREEAAACMGFSACGVAHSAQRDETFDAAELNRLVK